MNIRQAKPSDAHALSILRWHFHADETTSETKAQFLKRSTNWFQSSLTSNTWMGTVAETAGEVVACVFLQLVEKVPSPGRETNHWGYLTNFYTSPEYRGKGIGGQVLDSLINSAQEKDLELLIVWPSPESVSIYERAGFSDVQKSHSDPGDHPPMELVFK